MNTFNILVNGKDIITEITSDKLEGTSVSIFGSLFTNRVRKGTSVEKLPLRPKIVLFTGSTP